MNRKNRKMLLNLAAGIAVAAAAAVVFLPAAQAAPGVVTSNVNVRSGPGTGYGVVDTIARGTPVDVQRCDGSWCYVAKAGPDGWVSASYLSAGGRPVNPTQPGFSFGFQIGPDPDFGIGRPPFGRPPIGRPPIDRPIPLPEPVFGEACFYEGTRFRGESRCLEEGDSIRDLGRFADTISSIDNPDGLNVQVCGETNFRDCRTYTTSASSLGDFDDYIRSIRIR
jgi:hypothetical protein